MKRRLWVIALVTVASVGVAVALSLLQTPQYQATIKILIGQREDTVNAYNLAGDVQGLQQFASTLTEAVRSRPLAEAVIEEMDLQTTPEQFLGENLSVQPIPDTQFILVSYKDPDPEQAQRVANTVGEVFSEQISRVSSDVGAVTATVWEPAVVPGEPATPRPVRNGTLALALGLMLGLGLAFLLEYLDDRWDSPEEVEQAFGLPTFGVIPGFDTSRKDARKKVRG